MGENTYTNEIGIEIAKQLDTIQQLQEFVSLHFHRDTIQTELKELADLVPNVQQLLFENSQLLENYQTNVVQEYRKMIEKMRKQQLAMLFLVGEIAKKKKEPDPVTPRSQPDPVTPRSHFQQKPNQPETPRLYLSDYTQSPFISKIRPVALQFIDFERTLTPDEFNGIPKYMRGRETFEELSLFLQTIIIPCFSEKYQLLHRKRECIRNGHDLEIWKAYNQQVSYFPEHKFITQGDISRKVNKLVDKKISARIAMLRHLKILQEQRKASVVCYIWIV